MLANTYREQMVSIVWNAPSLHRALTQDMELCAGKDGRGTAHKPTPDSLLDIFVHHSRPQPEGHVSHIHGGQRCNLLILMGSEEHLSRVRPARAGVRYEARMVEEI